MADLDKQALNNRLFDNMNVEALQLVVENQPDEDLNDAQLWCRWIINPGLSTDRSLGKERTVTQYGTATLQIFVPKGLYTGIGDDVKEQFNGLFRGWRSADKALVVNDLKSTSSTYSKDGIEFHLINAMIYWHSNRRYKAS